MGARWTSYLRKRELEAILREFSLEATGTVEEMRSRLAAFNNRDDHVLEIAERLQECEAEITAALTDRKQRSPTPNPHPPGPTQLQVPALEGRGAADVVGDTEIHPVKRDIFPRKSEMSAATLAEKLKNWGITFDGTTDPITFIQHLGERATAYEVDVEKMTQAIPGLLTDTAEHWFRTSQLLGKSWTNFKKAFLDFFLPPRYFQRLEDEIRTRDQRRGETFKQYLVNIRLMMHRAGYNAEQELDRIYENLQPEYQMYARRHDFTTLEQLTTLAVNYEVTRDRSTGSHARMLAEPQPAPRRNEYEIPAYAGASPIGQKNFTPPARRPPTPATVLQSVPRVGNRSMVPNFSLACRNCAQEGHRSATCRNPRVLFCWDCGRRGVRTLECCRRTQPGNERSLRPLGERTETAYRNPRN